jgi:hypothetical protein
MTPSLRIFLALALGVIVPSARPIGCQELQVLTVGIQPAGSDTASVAQTQPSGSSLNVKSVRWAVSGSVLAGVAGFAIDQVYCNQRHGDEPRGLFGGPCTFYAGAGAAAGWFGGAIVGATLGAAKVAQKRGCPRSESLIRTFAGAALGAAPGSIIVAGRGAFPPWKSLLILGAPFLAGVMAASAVMGCQAA